MVILYFLAIRFKWCAIFCNSSSDVAIKIWSYIYSFFFFNRYCNPCGFWPPQLSLSILSRKGFTECRCQRHVKPPTWRTSDYNVPTPATTSETTPANPSSGRWNYGRENSENFAESGNFHVTFGFFYMP